MMSKLVHTELLAPGGSLSQAVHALRSGADAVYTGARRFSARAHAGNLDMNQFARLCGEAQSRSAAVYAAMNTIILNDEIPEALDLAWELWAAGASAFIIQDIGLLDVLTRHGPPVALHASTQMAIHSVSGARVLADWGLKRIVLSRELSVPEIAAIHQAVPDIELEVFIHGSLCYSVSGLCLASGLILQRSGNRGDCGQICRTWSTIQSSSGNNSNGSWFSMNDLDASDYISKLTEAGVTSFKIEGRMKPPEWTSEVVAHYRSLLDGIPENKHLGRSRQVFGRNPSSAWLGTPKGQKLINHEYAGSLGVVAGRIEEVKNGRALVKLLVDLAVSDGVMLLQTGSPPNAWKAGVRALASDRNITSWDAKAGTKVWVQAESDGVGFRSGDIGLELRKIADHAANLPLIKPESLPLFRRGLNIAIAYVDNRELAIDVEGFPDLGFRVSVTLENAQGSGSLVEVLAKQLRAGSESGFCAGEIKDNGTLAGWFIPPRSVKEIRRAWQLALVNGFTKLRQTKKIALNDELLIIDQTPLKMDFPKRSSLNPQGDLPFVTQFKGLLPDNLAKLNGSLVLPLAPVFFDDETAFSNLRFWILNLHDADSKSGIILGLGNLAHIEWYQRLQVDKQTAPAIKGAFADYGLYAANNSTRMALQRKIPELHWVIPWVEAAPLDTNFHPPLFISRACFRHQSQGLSCPNACQKSFDYQLEQGKRRFQVLVRDCISYTF